jgi:hypothetical protein
MNRNSLCGCIQDHPHLLVSPPIIEHDIVSGVYLLRPPTNSCIYLTDKNGAAIADDEKIIQMLAAAAAYDQSLFAKYTPFGRAGRRERIGMDCMMASFSLFMV